MSKQGFRRDVGRATGQQAAGHRGVIRNRDVDQRNRLPAARVEPPVQLMVISPVCSVKPSPRNCGVTATLVVQVQGLSRRTHLRSCKPGKQGQHS